MIAWTHPTPNTTELVLEDGDTLHVRPSALRSRRCGTRITPRWPHRSWIARLLAGVWVLDELRGADLAWEPLTLIGHSPISKARVVELKRGQAAVVRLHALQGFVLPAGYHGAPMATWLRAVLKPGYWMIGDPLPVVFEGPLHLLLSADGLAPEPVADDARVEILPSQLIVWDATADLRVQPQAPVNNLAAVANGLTFRSWVDAPKDAAPIVLLDYGSTRLTRATLAPWVGRHLLVGALISIALIYLADWIIREVLPLIP